MKKKQWWLNLLLLLAVIIIVLFFLEIILRIFWPQNMDITEFDRQVKHKLIPDSEVYSSSPYGDYKNILVRISSQGLREDKVYSLGHPGIYRIAMLGSSFTLGSGVPVEQTYPKLLEKKLQDQGKYEVINFAVPNYGPDKMYLDLIARVKYYQPDLVIMNLPTINVVQPSKLIRQDNSTFTFTPPSEPAFSLKVRRWLGQNYHTYIFMVRTLSLNPWTQRWFTKTGLFVESRDSLYGLKSEEEYNEGMKINLAIIEKARQFAQKEGFDFLVAVLPLKEEVDEDKFQEAQVTRPLEPFLVQGQVEMDLMTGLEKNNLPFISYTPTLKEKNLNNSLYFEFDGHLNYLGHEVAAEVLYEYLQENLPEKIKD